ncbi:MAG TPA: hypothetical protein VJ873_04975, partial [bacterium]|nr:hypothetical protein [bacterium]
MPLESALVAEVSAWPVGTVSPETPLTLALAASPMILVPVSLPLVAKAVFRTVAVFPRMGPLFPLSVLKAVRALSFAPAVGPAPVIKPFVLSKTLAVIPGIVPAGRLGMAPAHEFFSQALDKTFGLCPISGFIGKRLLLIILIKGRLVVPETLLGLLEFSTVLFRPLLVTPIWMP